MKVYLNGKIVNEDEALIPFMDRGVLFGDGIFEKRSGFIRGSLSGSTGTLPVSMKAAGGSDSPSHPMIER